MPVFQKDANRAHVKLRGPPVNVPTPTSGCLGLTKTPGAPGWFHIGGTSLSAPLFAALFSDRDAFHGHRSGAARTSPL
jgi:hypothetical protein